MVLTTASTVRSGSCQTAPIAPTSVAMPLADIEEIVAKNPDSVVIIDEAYVDFGAESALSLIHKYDNLLVTQTFSKSRSMAGARLGFGVGCKSLMADLNAIKYSTNPYNVNSMTLAAGYGTLCDPDYTAENCKTIVENREKTAETLKALGFEMTESKTNFLFAKHPSLDGETLYLELKKRGILVRHFGNPKISAYNRMTIGTWEQMQTLIQTIQSILEEQA